MHGIMVLRLCINKKAECMMYKNRKGSQKVKAVNQKVDYCDIIEKKKS